MWADETAEKWLRVCRLWAWGSQALRCLCCSRSILKPPPLPSPVTRHPRHIKQNSCCNATMSCLASSQPVSQQSCQTQLSTCIHIPVHAPSTYYVLRWQSLSSPSKTTQLFLIVCSQGWMLWLSVLAHAVPSTGNFHFLLNCWLSSGPCFTLSSHSHPSPRKKVQPFPCTHKDCRLCFVTYIVWTYWSQD